MNNSNNIKNTKIKNLKHQKTKVFSSNNITKKTINMPMAATAAVVTITLQASTSFLLLLYSLND